MGVFNVTIKQLQEQYAANTKEGLTLSQVASNREKYGKNKLPEKKQKTSSII